MALTADQLTDLQADLGLSDDEAVFTDDELNRLFERAASDYNTAVYLGWRQLLGDAAKLFKYTAGHTSIEKQQVFDHIMAMVSFWKDESRTNANQLKILGLNPIPPAWKDEPDLPRLGRRWQGVR